MKFSVPIDQVDLWFFGLRRSGNHAVLDWLLAHHENWCHYNNCVLQNGEITSNQKTSKGEDSGVVVASVEDEAVPFLTLFNRGVPENKIVTLVRDALNTFASRYGFMEKFLAGDTPFFSAHMMSVHAFEKWKKYAKWYLNDEQSFYKICFNKWYTDSDYRKQLSEMFGWEHTDNGLRSQQGWRFSGGSSYEAHDVLTTYKNLEGNEEFSLFFDEEALDLSRKLGVVPSFEFNYDKKYVEGVQQVIDTALRFDIDGDLDKAKRVMEYGQVLYPKSTYIKQVVHFYNLEFE